MISWKKYTKVIKLRLSNGKIPNRYDLQRLGLNWPGLLHRLSPKEDLSRILLISIPKSGTNLLERAICSHPDLYRPLLPVITPENLKDKDHIDPILKKSQPGQVLVSHLTYKQTYVNDLKKRGIKTVLMVRDPRDIVVSRAFFATRFKNHPCREIFLAQPSVKEMLKLSILGDDRSGVDPIRRRMKHYAGWLHSVDCLVRFEDLIGSNGNASSFRQKQTLEELYQAIDIPLSNGCLTKISNNLFSSKSPTFHKGQINRWKELFDEELEALFMEQAGDLLEKYGYE